MSLIPNPPKFKLEQMKDYKNVLKGSPVRTPRQIKLKCVQSSKISDISKAIDVAKAIKDKVVIGGVAGNLNEGTLPKLSPAGELQRQGKAVYDRVIGQVVDSSNYVNESMKTGVLKDIKNYLKNPGEAMGALGKTISNNKIVSGLVIGSAGLLALKAFFGGAKPPEAQEQLPPEQQAFMNQIMMPQVPRS